MRGLSGMTSLGAKTWMPATSAGMTMGRVICAALSPSLRGASDEAIQVFLAVKLGLDCFAEPVSPCLPRILSGLLRFARNDDGVGIGAALSPSFRGASAASEPGISRGVAIAGGP
jgi:hypothetical protein